MRATKNTFDEQFYFIPIGTNGLVHKYEYEVPLVGTSLRSNKKSCDVLVVHPLVDVIERLVCQRGRLELIDLSRVVVKGDAEPRGRQGPAVPEMG